MASEKLKGHLAAIITNVIFGLNINVAKSLFASSWMTPLGFTVTRISFAFVTFWILSLFTAREKTARRDLPILAVCGLLGLVITQVSFTVGLHLITPVTSSLIGALNPIIILLLSALFLSESISPKKAIGVIIGMSGAILMVLHKRSDTASSNSIIGIGIALLSGISYSAYFVIIRKIVGKYSSITIMKWMFLLAFILLLPFGIPELPKQRLFSREASLLPILLLGFSVFLSGILALFLLPVALKRIKATTASIYINLQPLTASAAAIIIGQDTLTWDKPMALILIVTGVLIVTQSKTSEISV